MKLLLTLVSFLFAVTAFAEADVNSAALEQAKAATQKGDLAAAEALLAPLITGEKPEAAACHLLGLVRQRQGRAAEAVALHERATALVATNPEYFSALGVALSERMRELPFTQQAVLAGKLKKAFAKSVELDPNHVPGLIGLVRFYANAPEIAGGSLEKAKELAERVRKLAPFYGELELGMVAERAEDFTEAHARFEAAAKLQPKNAGAHVSAGRMLAKLGRKDAARAEFQRALELDAKNEGAQRALAELGTSP